MLSEEELKKLYQELAFEEKLGQLLQLNGSYFGVDGVMTGEALNWEFSEDDVKHAGSVLNIFGSERLRKLQKQHLKQNRVPMIFMGDVMCGYGVAYQVPLGQACSFDPELVKKLARSAANAATAEGICVTFSPVADIARDARWGRCAETYGEDVALACKMVKAVVEGYQGTDPEAADSMAACVKHFAAYGYCEGGRDYNNVEVSERTLRETFLPSYRAAVDAGCEMVMTSFNSIGGVPVTIDSHLTREILREEWGFEGVIITDWCALLGCMEHRAADSFQKLALYGMNAGVDIVMMDYLYNKYIPGLLKDGSLDGSLFEEAVMRVLRLKNRKGLLEDPFRFLRLREVELKPQYDIALEAAEKSCVLLKNEEGQLPLKPDEKIALIGPYAVRKKAVTFWSSLRQTEEGFCKMPREALENVLGREVVCEPGCPMLEYENFLSEETRGTDPCYQDPEKYLEKAVNAARNADKVVLMLGEDIGQCGESASRTEIAVPDIQMELLRKIQEANPNTATLIFCGRPLDLREVAQRSKALMVCWMPGDAGSEAIAALLCGKAVPSAKLAMSFPYHVGQCPVHYDLYPTGHVQKTPKDRYSSRYVDAPNGPLYPFGFGLSYTEFEYSEIRGSGNLLRGGENLTVRIMVTNIGRYDGEEVVQMYLSDRGAALVSRPLRELKDFRRVSVPKGESVEVSFVITEEMLFFHDAGCQWKSEPGEYVVYIGGSSDAGKMFCFVYEKS